MPSATYRAAPAWDRVSPRRRGSGLALAIAVNALIVLVLIAAGAAQRRAGKPNIPLVIDFVRAPDSADASRRTEAAQAEQAKSEPPRRLPELPHVVPQQTRPLDMLILTREEYLAADIARLSRSAPAEARSAGDSREVGRAPNGEAMYGAEWHRRPTDAELAGYLPRGAPEGWGLIACRTAPGYRVEDCVELGNDPPGSRLAGAVRQAAWQFRVRPPRKGGKELIGAWVQIRIDYSRARTE